MLKTQFICETLITEEKIVNTIQNLKFRVQDSQLQEQDDDAKSSGIKRMQTGSSKMFPALMPAQSSRSTLGGKRGSMDVAAKTQRFMVKSPAAELRD